MNQSLNNYFSFKGRLNRWKFFIYLLPLIIFDLFLYVITLLMPAIHINLDTFTIIIFLIFKISLSVKRLHDLDKTGWFLLIQVLFFIPAINLILSLFNLYLLFAPGTKGVNKYGDDPLTNDYAIDY